MNINITDIQRFCMHDGPGIRTTVFFAGCPLSCRWCHNPETQSFKTQIYYDQSRCLGCTSCAVCDCNAHTFAQKHFFSREKCNGCGKCAIVCPTGALSETMRIMTVEEILKEVKKDLVFYGKNGGITLSGGEPMAQPDGAIELLRTAKSEGISTAVETSGYFDENYINELCRYSDMLLWDFKDSNNDRHIKNTGVSNNQILKNLYLADKTGIPIVLRCIVLKGINFDRGHLDAIKKLKSSLKNCIRADLLPYHPMGDSKNRLLGLENRFHDKKYIPDREEVERAAEYVNS